MLAVFAPRVSAMCRHHCFKQCFRRLPPSSPLPSGSMVAANAATAGGSSVTSSTMTSSSIVTSPPPSPKSMCEIVGEVLVFDLAMRNSDRFPCQALGWRWCLSEACHPHAMQCHATPLHAMLLHDPLRDVMPHHFFFWSVYRFWPSTPSRVSAAVLHLTHRF